MSEAKIVLSAVDRTGGAFASVKAGLDGVTSKAAMVTTALAGLGVTGAVASLIGMVRASNDAVDAFNDLADATGASIENISALDRVARETGASFDTVATALVKFNGALNASDEEGQRAGAVIKALGLNVDALRKMDPAEALQQTALALSKFADDGEKARATQVLFGKSLREIAPLLKDLAEAGQLNATTTSEQAQQAEKFNKELFRMQAVLTDLGRDVSLPLVGKMNDLADAIRSARREGDNLFELIWKFSPQAMLARGVFGIKAPTTNGYTESRKNVSTLTAALKDPSLLDGERAAIQEELARERARMEGFLNSNAGAGRGMGGYENVPRAGLEWAGGKGGGGGKAGTAARQGIDDASQSLASYVQVLQGAVDRTQELTEVERARTFLLSLGRTGEIAQVRELVLGMAEQADAAQAASKADKERMRDGRQAAMDAGDAVQAANREYQQLLKSLMDATPTAALERQRQAMQALAAEFQAGRISAEQFNEAATAHLGLDRPAPIERPVRDEFAEDLKDDLKGAFSQAFRDSSNPAKAFAEGLGNAIYSRVSAALAESLARNILSDIGLGSGSASLSGLAGLFGGGSSGGFLNEAGGLEIASSLGFHGGGIVGVGAPTFTRSVPARLFDHATRYHSGGLVGDEVPAILQKGEGVFTREQMKALGGGTKPVAINMPVSVQVDSRSDRSQVISDMTGILAENNRRLVDQLRQMGVVQG